MCHRGTIALCIKVRLRTAKGSLHKVSLQQKLPFALLSLLQGAMHLEVCNLDMSFDHEIECGAITGLGPSTFANLLPASGGASGGPQYSTPNNQYPMVRMFVTGC